MASVVIVGGGISGLSLAYRLQETVPAAAVTLLEQQGRPGGTLWTERRGGFQVELGPNGFLDNKPTTLTLCRDVGLGDRLVAAAAAAARNRYLFLGDRLRKLPDGVVSFLNTDLLTWRGKLSVLAERFRPPRREPGDESIDAFARRRAGREVAEVLADALVTGIYAGDPTLLSARATFPRLVQFEEQHGSITGGMAASAKQRRREAKAAGKSRLEPSRMWSFREGLRLLAETLAERLPRPPVLGVTVKRLEKSDAGGPVRWVVRGEGREVWEADAVVLTCPAYRQAELLADVDAKLAETVGGIAYNRVAVVALGYREADVPGALDGFGFLALQRSRRDLLGVQWCSSIFPDRAAPGTVLLRAMCGGWHRGEMVDWDDDRLVGAVRAELRLAMNVEAAPVFVHVVRWPRAIPQYHLGHLERVAWLQERAARHPGLFLGGNAYHGVSLNDCTEQGGVLAGRVAESIAGKPGGCTPQA
jgi:oxygen-dependent protoporphyrinogen oxidase